MATYLYVNSTFGIRASLISEGAVGAYSYKESTVTEGQKSGSNTNVSILLLVDFSCLFEKL